MEDEPLCSFVSLGWLERGSQISTKNSRNVWKPFISKGAAVCARHLYSGRSQWRSWSGRAGKLQCLHHRWELSYVFVRTIHYWYIYDDFLWIFMSPSSPILFQIMAHTVCGEPYWLGERLLSAPGPSGANWLNYNFSIILNFHEVFFSYMNCNWLSINIFS